MKRTKLFVWLTSVLGMLPFCGMAQTYDQLWKDVEKYAEKDLPSSVITAADKIYTKGQSERNIPQMMKAYIVRAEYRGSIVPDSLDAEKTALRQWAETETDPIARSVLNNIVGNLSLEQAEGNDISEAVRYFRLSVADRDLLVNTSAKAFRPMTVSGTLSEKYFGDNMFDLLVRQAIQSLSNHARYSSIAEKEIAYGFYDDLISHYETSGNRVATFLCKESKLIFRYENLNHFTQYELTADKMADLLVALASEYEGLAVCADAYLKAALYCLNNDEKVKAINIAQRALDKYPKSEWAADLKKIKEQATQAKIELSIPFIYPQYETEIEVSFTNVKRLTIELYRLNLTPLSTELSECKWASLLKKYGKKVSVRNYDLEPSADYKQCRTSLHYTLPQSGIYVVKQISNGIRQNMLVDYSLLYVSPYQCIVVPVAENKSEAIAVDRLSGHPVPGAEIAEYSANSYKLIKVHKTNEAGSVQLLSRNKRGSLFNVRTSGNDFMPLSFLGGTFYASWLNKTEEWNKKTTLFTDRAIYRPGQAVHVSGLLFEQKGDSVRVRKGEPVELKLYKNAQTYGNIKVTSDTLGTFAGDFTLPQSLLPGRYFISGQQGSVSIEVEEYKRPTFDVRFIPYVHTYAMGDTISLQGEAKTFSGVPVRNAKVKYSFSRVCRWWYRWEKQDNVNLDQGEIQTDSDGKFVVNVILKAPEIVDWGSKWSPCFYDYRLTADVTDGAGETQSSETALPVTNQSLFLSVQNLDDVVMREKQPSIQLQALNISRQPVNTTIEYRVYTYERGRTDEKGGLKYTGKAEAQHSFVPMDKWSLPSGKYIIELSAVDDKGRKCTFEKTFTLFSKEDHKVPEESVAWFYQDGDKFDEKNLPTFYVGTNASDVYLLIDVYNGQQRIDSKRMKLDNELRAFHYTYRLEYGDGILVKVAFMRKGLLYSRDVRIVRPEPQKELSLKWETFRDKLRPGDKEVWKLHISDRMGHAVQANLMAALYDASLDKLSSHNWNFGLSFPRPYPSANVTMITNAQRLYIRDVDTYIAIGDGLNLTHYPTSYSLWNRQKEDYTSLFGMGMSMGGYRMYRPAKNLMMARTLGLSVRGATNNIEAVEAAAAPRFKVQSGDAEIAYDEGALASEEESSESTVSVRENFAETAFFYPQLRTDSLGNVTIAFTVPESLTEWKFMGLAHTAQLDYGMMTAKTVTQKQFMVQPNMPRFVRRGDKATVAASLINMAPQFVKGIAYIELSDPVTNAIVYKSSEPFSVEEGETSMVRFAFDVPQKYDVLVCKITASAGEYSDGEQHYLPILTDKQWVTETIAVQVDGGETKNVKTDQLFNRQSKTATERRLTLEMTANPDWYAVQALPVAGNPQTEDALSWATAYYANALANVIVEANPHIKQVFDAWMAEGGDKETLLGNLERNQDLKNILLKETPWLTEATNESEQKRRIALLFDLNTMHSRLKTAIDKLRSLQNSDGSWSWFKGMEGSRYVTTQIAEEFARLKAMGVTLDDRMAGSYINAVKCLALCAKKDYEEMRRMEKENKARLDKILPNEQTIHYLYICALDKEALKHSDKVVNDYFLAKLENRSTDYTIYGKSLVAIVMKGANRTQQAAELVRSIKEYSVCTSEMGRYFDTNKAYYSWRNYKIPAEVAAMEAIYRVSPDEKMLSEMKQWLLKQKQVQMWESSIATADAVYAFLSMNGNKLNTVGKMKAVIGDTTYNTPDDALGYTRRVLTGSDTKVSGIQIEKIGNGIGWGAVYAQYQEKIDCLSEYRGQGVSVTRDYVMDGKPIASGKTLHVGDKLTVRLTVKADRDMDFIQIKDSRAACLEPTEQLSGYSWNGGLGLYRASYDASTCFFIDRMPKGTHRIEYTVYVDRVGNYQAGIATVQSAYSPEFGGHSGSFWLKVEE